MQTHSSSRRTYPKSPCGRTGGVTPYSLVEEDVRFGATLTSRGAGGETTEGLDWSGSGGNGLWRTGRGLGPGMGPKFFIILELLKR